MRFFVLPISDGIIMDGHPASNILIMVIMVDTSYAGIHHSKCWAMPITSLKMSKTKNLIFYSLIKVQNLRIVIFVSFLKKKNAWNIAIER